MIRRLSAIVAVLFVLNAVSVATALATPDGGHLAPAERGTVVVERATVAPVAAERAAIAPAPLGTTRSGFVYVDANGPVAGDGELRTYRLEVELDTGVNPRLFTVLAERILNDERAWTGADDWALQRVSESDADIRIVLATPDTVDRLCAKAGLDTGGEVSCWNGRYAALNVDRWKGGADGFVGSLLTYRRYLLNHEVGHRLGHGHKNCPSPGAPAPVMIQQSKSLYGCKANPWPSVAY